MACVHLQKLYELCQEHELRFRVSTSDLVRVVCRECGSQEVCPSNFTEWDAGSDQPDASAEEPSPTNPSAS